MEKKNERGKKLSPDDRAEQDYKRMVSYIEDANYNDKSKEQILRFDKYHTARDSSPKTKHLYLRALHYLAELYPDKPILSYDLENDVIEYKNDLKERGLKDTTTFYFLTYIKTFYLEYLDETKVKKELKFIKKSKANLKKKLDYKKILTHEEIVELVMRAGNKRDKAMIYLGWDSGLRATCYSKVKVGDLEPIQESGRQVYTINVPVENVKGKREQCIPVPVLTHSVPSLLEWLDLHEYKDDPEAPLFYSTKGKLGSPEFMSPKSYNQILQRVGKKTTIKKPIYWHGLRNSLTKYLRDEGHPDHIIRKRLGWSEKSNMLEQYSDFGREDVFRATCEKEGIQKVVKETKKIEAKECPRCGHVNPADSQFCKQCFLVLDPLVGMDMISEKELRMKELEEKLSLMEEMYSSMRSRSM